jgi:signal transduction histidine kinase
MNNLNIILSFILLLILFNILFMYNRQIINKQEQLQDANKDLERYNARIKGMTQDILYMYEAVNTISGRRGKNEIVHVLMDFAERASPECTAFYIDDDIGNADSLISSDEISPEIKDVLIAEYKSNRDGIGEKQAFRLMHSDEHIATICKLSGIKNFGAIGLLIKEAEYTQRRAEYESILLLISQLGATFFEKSEAETVDRELAVENEQNRIADDIHDSVVQRLFATSCFAYDTLKKWDKITDRDKEEQVKRIMENVQSSLKDLRSTIYNLSSKKQQINFFKDSIHSYLREMEDLTGIKINLDIKGDPDNLSFSAKKSLYRIIIECTGNAIKHSGCSNIWVDFHMGEEKTKLTVKDDGIGFDIDKATRERNGLGLYNIKSLIRSFNGSCNI